MRVSFARDEGAYASFSLILKGVESAFQYAAFERAGGQNRECIIALFPYCCEEPVVLRF